MSAICGIYTKNKFLNNEEAQIPLPELPIDIQNIDIKEIKGTRRLEAVIQNTYRYHFLR